MADSSTLYKQARQEMDQGRLAEAISLFQKSAALDPHFKTLELLGECLLRLGRPQEAVIPLAAATTLNAGVRAPALLAEAFLRLNDHSEAREMARLALSRDPNNRRARQVLEVVGPGDGGT